MPTPVTLRLTNSRQHEKEIIESCILGSIDYTAEVVEILEAGCGRQWPLDLKKLNYRLTGIDIDDTALSYRKNQQKDLDVAISGDLLDVELNEQSFDVIYCSFVLEHIQGAELAMKNFCKWLRPNGLLILKIPDPESVQGWITRNTPHWFHVLYYRYIVRSKYAGKQGFAPYPVYYDAIVSLQGVRAFCATFNFSVIAEYGDGYLRPGKGMMKVLVHSVKHFLSLLSLRRLSARHPNLLLILKKH
jgi:SAM-dependent methyltransferase